MRPCDPGQPQGHPRAAGPRARRRRRTFTRLGDRRDTAPMSRWATPRPLTKGKAPPTTTRYTPPPTGPHGNVAMSPCPASHVQRTVRHHPSGLGRGLGNYPSPRTGHRPAADRTRRDRYRPIERHRDRWQANRILQLDAQRQGRQAAWGNGGRQRGDGRGREWSTKLSQVCAKPPNATHASDGPSCPLQDVSWCAHIPYARRAAADRPTQHSGPSR